TVLGVDAITEFELEHATQRWEGDALSRYALEVHLDPRLTLVPQRDVSELLQPEIGAQLPVEALKDVLVECGGYALRIVIGGQHDPRVLAQIGAEEQVVPGGEHGAYIGEQRDLSQRIVVAKAGADEQHQARPGQPTDVRELILVTTDHRMEDE